MGKKRPHSEADGEGSGHSYSHSHGKRPQGNKPWAKRQKVDSSEAESLTAIKKRARALERLLSLDQTKVPADKLNELQRELAAQKRRIAEATAKKQRSKMIGKYHMVRFFERQKATRLANQLRKRIAQTQSPDELAQLQADLHVAEVDLDYAIYYPFLEPYVSLYAKPGDNSGEKGKEKEKDKAEQLLRTPRPAMWTTVEKLRKDGKEALERLQNRQPEGMVDALDKGKSKEKSRTKVDGDKGDAKPPGKRGSERNGKPSQKGKTWDKRERGREPEPQKGRESDDESDSDGGGFFEED